MLASYYSDTQPLLIGILTDVQDLEAMMVSSGMQQLIAIYALAYGPIRNSWQRYYSSFPVSIIPALHEKILLESMLQGRMHVT